MSGISGVNILPAPAVITSPTINATTIPAPAKTETPPNPPYIVDLTGTALAKSFKLQGQSLEQISVAMGLDIKTVDSYLGVQPTEPTLIPAPAPTPATPADLIPSTSASLITSQTIPAPTKSTTTIPGLNPTISTDQTPGTSTAAQGASGIPAVPAALAPPASFSSHSSANSPPSAVKALGI
jgi:hypothetical protein